MSKEVKTKAIFLAIEELFKEAFCEQILYIFIDNHTCTQSLFIC